MDEGYGMRQRVADSPADFNSMALECRGHGDIGMNRDIQAAYEYIALENQSKLRYKDMIYTDKS